MGISELMRRAEEKEEQIKKLGIDDRALERIRKDDELINAMERLSGYPNHSIDDLRAKLAEAVASAAKSTGLALYESSILNSVNAANTSALKLMEGIAAQSLGAEQFRAIAGARADNWLNFKDLYAAQIPFEKFLGSHLSQITQTSILAQSALAGIDFSSIGARFIIPDETRALFIGRFTDFSISYQNLFESFGVPETNLFRLPPSVSELPTNEFFNGVDLLETTVDEDNQDEYEEERLFVRDEIRESTKDSVIIKLEAVNEHWVPMLEGARQALVSTNPDKTRHCITSLRELFTQVMQHLSPDEQIREWSKSPDDFDKNRPTRKARLRYIVRDINQGSFSNFVEKDIESLLAAVQVFNAGTHNPKNKFTEKQLSALIARMEGAIQFLFSIAESEE